MLKNTPDCFAEIRSMNFAADINAVLDVWLSASIAAHDFIPVEFWQQQVQNMKEVYLPQTQNHVYTHRQEVLGFSALQTANIGEKQADVFLHALFVHPLQQGKGIGKQLLKHALQQHQGQGALGLSVYCANQAAVAFYEKQGFKAYRQEVDPQTQQPAWLMGIRL